MNTKDSLLGTEKAEGKTLSIFCVDEISIKDKTTFYSRTLEDLQITYWFDEEIENAEERVDRAFDLLFGELMNINK